MELGLVLGLVNDIPRGKKRDQMDTLTGIFFPPHNFFPGGKKCLNLGTFFPWGKKTPRQFFFPRGKVMAGAKSGCYTGLNARTLYAG